MSSVDWVPTPTFLYRNYLYERIVSSFSHRRRFLLIGTGTGYFLKKLLDMKFRGVGVDISAESIAVSREFLGKLPKSSIELKKADLFEYRPRRKFDLVFCFEVLEHIKQDGEALEKIHKFLNPKGQLVLSVPAHMSQWGKMDEMGGHIRRYEREELLDKLKAAGFKVETFWSYGFPFLVIIRWFSGSGKFVRKFKHGQRASQKTQRSGIRVEYDSRLRPFVASKAILGPMFLIMNIFLSTDLGLGYLVVARRS